MADITFEDGGGNQRVVPEWATESTLQRLVTALTGKQSKEQQKKTEQAFRDLSDGLGDLGDNLEQAGKAFKNSSEQVGDRAGEFIGKVVDKTVGVALLTLGTAAAVTTASLTRLGTSLNTLSQSGLALSGNTIQQIASLNELGLSTDDVTKLMLENSQAFRSLGSTSTNQVIRSFLEITRQGNDLGMSLEDSIEFLGDELTLRTQLLNLGALDIKQRGRMSADIVQLGKDQLAFSKALGVSTSIQREFSQSVIGNNQMLMANMIRTSSESRAQLFTGLQGFLSGMRAMGGEVGGEIAEAVLEAASMGAIGFSDAAFGFITVLPQLSDNMQSVISAFNSGMINGEQAAMAITNELGNLSDAEKNRVFLLARAGDEQAKAMASAITQFEQSADRMKKQGNTLEGVQRGFQVFQAILDKIKGQFSAAFNSFIQGFGSVFTSSEDFDNMLKDITNSFQPVIKELFGLNVASGKTSQQLKDLGKGFGDKLLPRIQGFANWMADTIVFLKGYFSQFEGMGIGEIIMSMLKDAGSKIMEGITYALGQVPWFKVAMYIAAGITTAFAAIKLGTMLGGAIGGLFGMGGGAVGGAGAAAGMKAMAGGLAAFANPAVALGLGAITLAVIGLAGAFSLASLGFEAFGKMMKSILDGVAPVVESFGVAIKSVFEGIGSVIESVGTSISGIVNSIGNVIEKYGEMKVGRINAEADAMVKTTEATTAAIQDLSSLDPQNIMGLATGIDAMGVALESFAGTMTPGFLDTLGQGFASLIGADSPVQAVIQLSNEADPVKIMEVAKATMATNAANAGATELDPSLSQNSTDNSSQTNTYNTTNNNSTSDTNIDVLETLNVLASQNDLQLEALKKANRILGEISNKQ
jgi:hypothetical protein